MNKILLTFLIGLLSVTNVSADSSVASLFDGDSNEVTWFDKYKEDQVKKTLENMNYYELTDYVSEFASEIYQLNRSKIPFFNKVEKSNYTFSIHVRERFKKTFPNSKKFTSLALENSQKVNDIMRKITTDMLVFSVKDWFKRDRAKTLKLNERNNIDKAVRAFREKRGELARQCDAEIRRAKDTKRGGRSKELHKHMIKLTIDKAVTHYRETVKNLDIKLQEDIELYKAPLRNAIGILKTSTNKSLLRSLKFVNAVSFIIYRAVNK